MSRFITIALLLVGAQVNLSALVPAAPGQAPPPWFTGGGILWPFFADTRTLLPAGGLRDTITPVLGITAAVCFLMAAAAYWGWLVPGSWVPALIVIGALASAVLQVAWLSSWAVVPLLVDAALVCAMFGGHLPAVALRS